MPGRSIWAAGVILSLLIGLIVGAIAFGPSFQTPETHTVTLYETTSFTKTIYSTQSILSTLTQIKEVTKTESLTETETQTLTKTSTTTVISTITELSYLPIKVPYQPDIWKEWPPTTILNPDFQYDAEEAGVLPCNDWCGYGIWVPRLSEGVLPWGLVYDDTETVVIMHPHSKDTPARIYQWIGINSTKRYILKVRARNVAACSPEESECGDSILVLKLTAGPADDIEIARIVLDTRKGWIERSYDITNLIRKNDYFSEAADKLHEALLVVEVQAGGPRCDWWGEWTAIDYVELEVR